MTPPLQKIAGRSIAPAVTEETVEEEARGIEILSHDFEDYFLDPDPRISTLSRMGVGASLGLAPIAVPVALLSGACTPNGKGFVTQHGSEGSEAEAETENEPPLQCADGDHDGFYTHKGCGTERDCDDHNNDVYPGAVEVCDHNDNNCNGDIDEGAIMGRYYADVDGDGFGNAKNVSGCLFPDGCDPKSGICYVAEAEDCHDNDRAVNPAAAEVCDGIDNNCAAGIDEIEELTPEFQACETGVGACITSGREYKTCEGKAGWSKEYSACDAIPGDPSPEICDGADNDCDGTIDNDVGPVLDWTLTDIWPSAGNNEILGMTMDSEGNFLVTGYVYMTGQNGNMWINKYDPDGIPIWDAPVIYNGPGNGTEAGREIVTDDDGNIYVIGHREDPGVGNDVWIVKYDAERNLVWESVLDGSYTYQTGGIPDNDSGTDIVLGSDGYLYIAGQMTEEGEDNNIWFAKMDPEDGHVEWERKRDGAAHGNDGVWDIKVDEDGNIYLAGFMTVAGEGFNIWTAKYNPEGTTVLWEETVDGGSGSFDIANRLALQGGFVYVAGEAMTSSLDGRDIWIRKMSADDGGEMWTRMHSGPSRGIDFAYDVAVDSSGNVFVTGGVEVAGEGINMWTAMYNAEGEQRWTTTEAGPGGITDAGYAIAVGPSGNVYVGGYVAVGSDTTADRESRVWKYICTTP